jgi:hypothetical protein
MELGSSFAPPIEAHTASSVLPDADTVSCLTTREFAARFHVDRGVFTRFLALLNVPCEQQAATPGFGSRAKLYSSENARRLARFLEACRHLGGDRVLEAALEAVARESAGNSGRSAGTIARSDGRAPVEVVLRVLETTSKDEVHI